MSLPGTWSADGQHAAFTWGVVVKSTARESSNRVTSLMYQGVPLLWTGCSTFLLAWIGWSFRIWLKNGTNFVELRSQRTCQNHFRLKSCQTTLNHERASGIGGAPLREAEHQPEVRPGAVVSAVVGGEDPPRVQERPAAPGPQRVRLRGDENLPIVGSILQI